MRRTVRASMFRTAFNAALLLLAGWIVVWFLSALVIQPLLVNRGGRAADAVRMSLDLPAMTNPGAVLVDGRIESGILSRRVDLTFATPVGAGLEPGVTTSTSIGILGIRSVPVEEPQFPSFEVEGGALEQLRSLGDGTVATITVRFQDPITVDRAQEIAAEPGYNVGVVWAGFDASLGRDIYPTWTWGGTLGYGTCNVGEVFDDDVLGSTSAGFSRDSRFGRLSLQRALDSVIAALDNIQGRDELIGYVVGRFGDDPADVSAVLNELRTSPRVTTLVVTGPSSQVARFLENSPGGSSATLLAVDFYNWTPGICGGSE